MKNNNYAVVTGAGQGLGQAFSRELAAMGNNVILVSQAGEGLAERCQELIDTYSVHADYFEADLTQVRDIELFAEWLENKYNVSILINNVGLGASGEFLHSDIQQVDQMILLNIRATTWLTHKLMPLLLTNEHSYILNVSSMASFYPIPFKTVYSASKVYIEYFSKGLSREYKHRGLHISSVHPGPMKTNSDVRQRIKHQHWFGLMGLKTPEDMARSALKKMFGKTSTIIVGAGNRFHWALIKLLPESVKSMLFLRGIRKEMRAN
jgi:short-subunit dehydrogenase